MKWRWRIIICLITEENTADEGLFPFFNYDELFGTVLNRFVVQAVAGYPLTVYGKGEADPGVFEYQGYPQLRKAGPGESG
jgi:hypothetical protein